MPTKPFLRSLDKTLDQIKMKRITTYNIHKNLYRNKKVVMENYLISLSNQFDSIINLYLSGKIYQKGMNQVSYSKEQIENALTRRYEGNIEGSINLRFGNYDLDNKVKTLIGMDFIRIEEIKKLTLKNIDNDLLDTISDVMGVIRIQ